MVNRWVLFCTFGCLMASGAFANLILIGNNFTLSFNAVAASFARPVNGSKEHGRIFLASPLDACSPLNNTSIKNSTKSAYVLIIRGGCGFSDKVRRAQAAGFKAAIVYNNEDSDLISMAGDSHGIHIHAVFVSQSTGLKLQKYIGMDGIQLWLVENYENSAWSIMALSFISLLAMSAVLATCFFVRRHRIRRGGPRTRVREFHGMSSQLVRAMPSLEFTEALEDNCTSATCAICLDDYNVGDKIRILPCSHKFHMICVDAWLTSWRTFCPVCKRDANTTISEPPATERTPLLSSTPSSMASTSLSTYARSSSYMSSRPMQIGRPSPSASYTHSVSNTPRQSLQSYQSSLDMRNASSSLRSSRALLPSPSMSPLNSIYMPVYSSPGNRSSSYIQSSSQQAHYLRHGESVASYSPLVAAQSPLQC